LVGNGADPFAVEVALMHGLDLSGHRSQLVNSLMCQRAELILVMELNQKLRLERISPLTRGKVYRLGDSGNFDIGDPYQKTKIAFETAYTQIARGMGAWASRIRPLTR